MQVMFNYGSLVNLTLTAMSQAPLTHALIVEHYSILLMVEASSPSNSVKSGSWPHFHSIINSLPLPSLLRPPLSLHVSLPL